MTKIRSKRDLMPMTEPEIFEDVFRSVINSYRCRFLQWWLSSTWRDLAFYDAEKQAESVVRWSRSYKEWRHWHPHES